MYIVGFVILLEYVYEVVVGFIFLDNCYYGVVWMGMNVVLVVFCMDGVFNDFVLFFDGSVLVLYVIV